MRSGLILAYYGELNGLGSFKFFPRGLYFTYYVDWVNPVLEVSLNYPVVSINIS